MPTINEPLILSKTERLIGQGPPLRVRIRYHARRWVPNPGWVARWVATGAFVAVALMAAGILFSEVSMSREDKRAGERRRAVTAETRRKADQAAAKIKDTADFEDMRVHAIGNWETWRHQFTNDKDGIVCAHGHVFNSRERHYDITCQVGPKGSIPTHVVRCNQGACQPPEEIKTPPQPPPNK